MSKQLEKSTADVGLAVRVTTSPADADAELSEIDVIVAANTLGNMSGSATFGILGST